MTPFEAPDGSLLSRLIGCSPDEFADNYWAQDILLTRAQDLPASFEDLFSADAVDDLLSKHGVRLPFLRMVNKGQELTPEQFTRSGGMGSRTEGQVADDMVLVAMNEGASLVFEGIHRFWPPLVEFTTRLSAELGHPIRSNAHVTPPHARGLSPHHDYHDVFVVQIAGRKRWRLHRPAVLSPLFPERVDGAAVRARAAEEPLLETVIGPGDVLYLPRGVVHSASTEDETSIHITIGVPAMTRFDLVTHFMETLKDHAELRASLPMGVNLSDPSTLVHYLEQTLDIVRGSLNQVAPLAATEYVTTTMIERTRPEPIRPLEQLALARGLDGSTKLRARVGLRILRQDSEEEIRLTRHNRFCTFPRFVQDALNVALAGGVFTPADLPGLSSDDQFAFTRRLITEGFVVPANAAF